MSIKDKFLEKSDRYQFFQKEYHRLKRENKRLDERNKLASQVNDYEELVCLLENIYKENKVKTLKDFKDINIAYVLRGFPILSETFVVSEIKWLIDKGFNVYVFTHKDPFKPVDLDFYIEEHRFESVTQLETLLIKYDIDLMHTHFVYPTGTLFTCPAAEKLDIPFTLFAHAYDIFRYTEDRLNHVDKISKSPNCLGIFTLSEYHKNHLMQRGVDEDKIIITKQASNYEILPIEEKTNEFKKIITLSRFVEKKGIDVLIRAAKLLEDEDFEFSLYGFGGLEEEYRQLISDLGCDNVKIEGEVHPSDVKNILLNSDLLVAPCRIDSTCDRDGFPTVIFEAMGAGLPTLSTTVSAIPEIIKDGYNGFLTEPNQPELLAEKIKEISKLSSAELYKIRKQAQEDVKNISSVDKTMEKYIETVSKR